MSLGIYISVPFCRTKCSFCNFASGVFSKALFDRYVSQVCAEIEAAESIASHVGGGFDPVVDSIYLGGGTPSMLSSAQLERLFHALDDTFEVERSAEITVECAPGTITDQLASSLARCGVNRVSLGVQSFVDEECSAVGRSHSRVVTLADIGRLRAAGIGNIGIDLIAGLPHQTEQSWDFSLGETLASGVPHVSVYMLEVDEESRLGNELLAGGSRYHAHFVPDDDLTADLYLSACERLEKGGVQQYEISNFARRVTHGIGLRDSRHNLKYWTREPYLGFGVDAHSMLPANDNLQSRGVQAIRFATPDALETYSVSMQSSDPVTARRQQLLESRSLVDAPTALEESFFLGLRMNCGVSLAEIRNAFGDAAIESYQPIISELQQDGLLDDAAGRILLTPRGRLLSNEVFARFLRENAVRH